MNTYLLFSDTAKFADIARSIFLGNGYVSNFTFWAVKIFSILKENWHLFSSIPPVMPYSIAVFFRIFGVTDFAVIATSFFYFILTLIFVYLLGKKMFGSKLIGALSALAVGGSYDLIYYGLNGASESPFIFEIVAGLYFVSLKKKWASLVTVLFLVLMYFTRPQAFIYITGIIFFWLLISFNTIKALISFVGIGVLGLLFDYIILRPLSGHFFLYSIIGRGLGSSFNQSVVASDALRGATQAVSVGLLQVFKNVFYNLYNFYKALPEIINPYLFTLFIIGLFFKSKDKDEQSFKVVAIFMVLITFVVTAASIPFYRYIHPVLPLIYIVAVGTLVTTISNFQSPISKKINIILISLFIILFFGVGQTVGKFVLDSRFEAKMHNVGKAPVYVELSKILKENTTPNDIVITNLDTWGSWYGERKTVWFPMEPKQLIDPSTNEIPFDAIYLTSYKIDDANYFMGEGWKMIFENPKDSSKWKCDGCDEIAEKYTLKGIYKVDSTNVYEREDATSILLIKK